MSELAILGGEKVRKIPYPWHVTTDEEDVRAAVRVLESGVLSVYEGANTEYFMGGTEVQALEKEWATKFGVKHAVADGLIDIRRYDSYCQIRDDDSAR